MNQASHPTLTFAVRLQVRTAKADLSQLIASLGPSGPGFRQRGEERLLSPQARARGESPVFSESRWTFPSDLADSAPLEAQISQLLDRAEESWLPLLDTLRRRLRLLLQQSSAQASALAPPGELASPGELAPPGEPAPPEKNGSENAALFHAELDIAVFHVGPTHSIAMPPSVLQRLSRYDLGLRLSYYLVDEDPND